MQKYENIFIIDYQDLQLDYFEQVDKNFSVITDILYGGDVKNDTIYNTYPYEIKAFDLTNPEDAKFAYGFINWFVLKKQIKYFDDMFKNEYCDTSREEMTLRWLCTLGEIEEGNYLIRISW